MNEPAIAKPSIWFVDTSSLISLAVDEELRSVVKSEVAGERCVLLDVVIDELEILAQPGGAITHFAKAALQQLDWLGEPVPVEGKVDVQGALQIQDVIRGARALKHNWEHWAESVTIDIASRLTLLRPYFLAEDYNARVEAKLRGMQPYSVHKLLGRMVNEGKLSAADAARFAALLQTAGRGAEYTEEDFQKGTLGRVGKP